ncbi:MAG: ATP-binding protein [Gammaproteobacteria bacterium]|nr:ATP-binding protein [Gammaproteobacteria bacterium]
MRRFNTEGPVRLDDHYAIPPLERVDVDHVLELIRDKRYFVLHAPRQTGKTSALMALAERLVSGGSYRCVYVNVEVGQSAREDTAAAVRAILSELGLEARLRGDDTFDGIWPTSLQRGGPHGALSDALALWAAASSKPLVLLIDEIDALIGDSLLAVLRQLRSGYARRPNGFPQSIVLCGVRDVRDYRIRSSAEDAMVLGGSAFNISAESLRLGDFGPGEVEALLMQHTGETGQAWSDAAKAEVWDATRGQPWLVNALADEACFRNKAGRDRSRPIDVEAIREARERLIGRRVVHLDQLAHKLEEERVRRVIEPLLSGAEHHAALPADDLRYVRDLGLIAQRDPVQIANPIYREVVPRDLTYTTQATLVHEPAWYLDADGALRVGDLLAGFQRFFREHSEHWVERFQYKEAGPQLLLQAFLQRLVDGGGRIEREYGLGRMRTDLLIVWPLPGEGMESRTVIECKVLHRSLQRTVRDGVEQTLAYMDRCGAREGHLVVFDRAAEKSWDDKVFQRDETAGGRTIRVWGM